MVGACPGRIGYAFGMALYENKTYRAEVGEHSVDFEFDRSGVVINRGRLIIDGQEVAERAVFWGNTEVRGALPDGREFTVEFGSGFVGQLKRVELVLDGERTDLEETVEGPPAQAG